MPRISPSPTLPREFGSDRYRLFLQQTLGFHAQELYRAQEQSLIVACSDETTALTVGTAKVTFRFPWSFHCSEIRGSLSTAQASGTIFTVDVNINGATMLSTKLTIDNGEKTSYTAATPAVISTSSIALDDEITVDIDQIGNSTAKGLKVTFIGYRL